MHTMRHESQSCSPLIAVKHMLPTAEETSVVSVVVQMSKTSRNNALASGTAEPSSLFSRRSATLPDG